MSRPRPLPSPRTTARSGSSSRPRRREQPAGSARQLITARDPAARLPPTPLLPARSGAKSMNATIRALVALETGLARYGTGQAFAAGTRVRGPGHGSTARRRRSMPRGTAADLLFVACSARSGSSISLIERMTQLATRAAGRRALQLAASDRTGSCAGCSRPAPTTSSRCRSRPSSSGSRSRRRSRAAARSGARRRPRRPDRSSSSGPRAAPARPSPPATSASRSPSTGTARRAGRPRPAVRRRRTGARPAPERTIYDLARAGGTLDADKVERLPDRRTSRACACCSRRRGPTRRQRSRVEFLREVYAILRDELRLRDRRHAAGLHARGDRGRSTSSTDIVHGRHARRALAQEHQARPRDARPDGLRPAGHVSLVLNRADTQRRHHRRTTSRRSSGGSPTC